MLKTIVVGVDGREGGRDALDLAGRFGFLTGADIFAVRVVAPDPYAGGAATESDAKTSLAQDIARTRTVARPRVVFDASGPGGLHRIAAAERADLIVVGSTHRSRVGRVFAGDRAAATVHGSPCAVAIAPRGLAERRWEPVTRIGVGFDGGPEARQALRLAVGLARRCGASIKVRGVVAVPLSDTGAGADDDQRLDRSKASATTGTDVAFAGIDSGVAGEIVAGVPVRELVSFSEGLDLLIVGSRGPGPLRRIVTGSAGADLLRHARCPVLVFPRNAATRAPGDRAHTPTRSEVSAG